MICRLSDSRYAARQIGFADMAAGAEKNNSTTHARSGDIPFVVQQQRWTFQNTCQVVDPVELSDTVSPLHNILTVL